jgi:hypothetical protein
MPLKSEFMARGMPGGQANLIGQDPASAPLTATGNSQATALSLVSSFSVFGTVAASTGAIIGEPRGIYFVANNGANTLTLYPPVGGNINGGTLNAGISIPTGKSAIAISNGLTWGVNVSA